MTKLKNIKKLRNMKRFKIFITIAITLVLSASVAMAVTMSVDEVKELVSEVTFGAFPGPEVYMDVTVYGTLTSKNKTTAITPTSIYSTTTLRIVDSGTSYTLSGSGTTITLPAVASSDGVKLRFIVIGAATDGNFIINSAEGDNIEGSIIVAGAVVDCNDADALNFVVDGENLGDFFEIMSDGTNWFPLASGVLTSAKLTCTG